MFVLKRLKIFANNFIGTPLLKQNKLLFYTSTQKPWGSGDLEPKLVDRLLAQACPVVSTVFALFPEVYATLCMTLGIQNFLKTMIFEKS